MPKVFGNYPAGRLGQGIAASGFKIYQQRKQLACPLRGASKNGQPIGAMHIQPKRGAAGWDNGGFIPLLNGNSGEYALPGTKIRAIFLDNDMDCEKMGYSGEWRDSAFPPLRRHPARYANCIDVGAGCARSLFVGDWPAPPISRVWNKKVEHYERQRGFPQAYRQPAPREGH
jgi:hypothetical protein